MMKFSIVAFCLALACALAGCSKTFMCHLNGTSCPASPQAASGGGNQSSGGGEGAAESTENTSSEASENKAEAPSAPKANSNPNCKPSGATCEQSYQCCSEACVTHSPDNYCR